MKETELKPMKAWLVRDKESYGAEIVFAETRGKARSLALSFDCCDDSRFTDVEVRRAPYADKYYKEGKVHLDWDNPIDRIVLVKECSFVCDYEYLDWEDCESCSARNYCDRYQDHLTEEGADTVNNND
jgi:hypothetical protein